MNIPNKFNKIRCKNRSDIIYIFDEMVGSASQTILLYHNRTNIIYRIMSDGVSIQLIANGKIDLVNKELLYTMDLFENYQIINGLYTISIRDDIKIYIRNLRYGNTNNTDNPNKPVKPIIGSGAYIEEISFLLLSTDDGLTYFKCLLGKLYIIKIGVMN